MYKKREFTEGVFYHIGELGIGRCAFRESLSFIPHFSFLIPHYLCVGVSNEK
jgi:hypothetical protein